LTASFTEQAKLYRWEHQIEIWCSCHGRSTNTTSLPGHAEMREVT
jgi:hypothetical protein